MASLIIPVGIPGSGKSTWAHKFTKAELVSSDAIRIRMFGSLEAAHDAESKERNNAAVFHIFHDWIRRRLALGMDVVADATNLNHEARARLREIAVETSAETHLVLFQNLTEASARNRLRGPEDRVPDDAMSHMLGKYIDTMNRLPDEQYTTVTKITSFS